MTAETTFFRDLVFGAAVVGGAAARALVGVARNAHLVGDDIYNATLATSVVTILINALLIRLVPQAV